MTILAMINFSQTLVTVHHNLLLEKLEFYFGFIPTTMSVGIKSVVNIRGFALEMEYIIIYIIYNNT